MTREHEETREVVARILGGYENDTDSTNHIVDSIKKPTMNHWEHFIHRSPVEYRHPKHSLCLNPTYPQPVAGFLCVFLTAALRASFGM